MFFPIKELFKAIRVQQGIKNFLVFVPLFLAGRYADPTAWKAAAEAFFAVALLASATYLVNDLLDLTSDRRHWTKRHRPLAAGLIPPYTALAASSVLAIAGLLVAMAAGPTVLLIALLYAIITTCYSFWLKRIPVVDTLIIAGLFSLRLLIGVVAIGAAISPWLFVFSTALFLSIALVKRHTEVLKLTSRNEVSTLGRGYRAVDEPFLLTMGISSAVSSTVFLSLYLMSESVQVSFYLSPKFLWLAPIAIFLWLGRIWLLSQRGELSDDPVAFSISDVYSWLLGGVVVTSFILAAHLTSPI